jgi:hypothetical protein
MEITPAQKEAILHYARLGIVIEPLDDVILVKQKHLMNGLILTQKELIQRARSVFPVGIIKPSTFSLQLDKIDLPWVNKEMLELGLKRNDLIKLLGFDKSSLSLILSGNREMTRSMKAGFFYLFQLMRLRNSVSEEMNETKK